MTSKQLSYKLGRLPLVIQGWVDEGLNALTDQIHDLNVQQMEEYGQDSMGRSFGPYEDKAYQALKAIEGKESRFINLHFDGDFHKSIQVDVTNGSIKIWSKPNANNPSDKVEAIEKEFGPIYGLQDKNMDWLVDELADHLETRLRSYFV
jgi:hypothetical protein